MKIREIIPQPIDITKEIMEAFDRVLPYHSLGNFIKKDTKFFIYAIEDTDPLIKIQVKIKKIDEKMIGELSFFTDEFGFEQLNISSSGLALSILATVTDLGAKFIPQIAVMFFTCKVLVGEENSIKALKEVRAKSRIYSRLAKRIAEENNLNFQSFSVKEDYGFVLTKDEVLSTADIAKYQQEWRN